MNLKDILNWSIVCRSWVIDREQSLWAFWRQTWRQKMMPDMASDYLALWQPDAMSVIVLGCHVWRQKAVSLVDSFAAGQATNDAHNSGQLWSRGTTDYSARKPHSQSWCGQHPVTAIKFLLKMFFLVRKNSYKCINEFVLFYLYQLMLQ